MNLATPRFGQTVSTRRAKPSYQPWQPLPYMTRAVDFLTASHAAGLPLRPGGRKTSITLAAFLKLRKTYPNAVMLVIAPLRVCRQTWRQEAAKWEEFRGLKFSLLHGPKKDERLNDDADIWLINPEGVDWLRKKFFGRTLKDVFDVVTIDELTKFKNSQAERSKALQALRRGVGWVWGLTGSLVPNGYMDLFGQMKILDEGAALGRYITHYRDQYFSLGYDGFTYDLMPGAEARIVERIAPYWFQMAEEDYAQLPPLVNDERVILLEPAAQKLYDRMKRDMLAELPEGIITAANSAACYSKLSQMANGAVYVGQDHNTASVIHDLKLDAIEELLEELQGEPLLVAYEFNHDLERLRDRFGTPDASGKKVLPYLGNGTTAAQEDAWVAAWNRGELPLLCCHPASAGHGLNMQGASAANVAWFGITWDFELYDQFIRRIRRDGTKALQIFNHLLIVKGTIDELKLAALSDKDMTQGRLVKALNAVIRFDAEAFAAGGSAAHSGDNTMVMKLSRPGAAAQEQPAQQQPQAEVPRVQPKGWGAPKGDAAPVDNGQKERIQENLTTGGAVDRSGEARSSFGQRTQAMAETIRSGAEPVQEHSNGVRTDQPTDKPEPVSRTRRKAEVPDGSDAALAKARDMAIEAFQGYAAHASNLHEDMLRLGAVKVAAQFKDNFADTADMFALADEILAYVTKAAKA